MRPSPCGACCGGICGKARHCGTMQASPPTNHVQRSQHTARQNSSAVAFPLILYKGKYAFQHAEKKSDLWQHRTIPALRLKHRSGSCGTASALPKCSIMSGCGTRIVLRGQKPLALCDRCPCFGSLFPPLEALTFAASSIICAFGLAAAAPRSPYRHLELCGIALKKQNQNRLYPFPTPLAMGKRYGCSAAYCKNSGVFAQYLQPQFSKFHSSM